MNRPEILMHPEIKTRIVSTTGSAEGMIILHLIVVCISTCTFDTPTKQYLNIRNYITKVG